jgi:hypothetical protein
MLNRVPAGQVGSWRILSIAVGIALLATAVTSCAEDSFLGTYQLRLINGSSVPYTSSSTTWNAGSIIVRSDASFTLSTTASIAGFPNLTNVTDTIGGTWSRGGGLVRFHPTHDMVGPLPGNGSGFQRDVQRRHPDAHVAVNALGVSEALSASAMLDPAAPFPVHTRRGIVEQVAHVR